MCAAPRRSSDCGLRVRNPSPPGSWANRRSVATMALMAEQASEPQPTAETTEVAHIAPTSSARGSQWLSLKDASDFLGVHFTTLRGWADRGEIPVFRTPGGHRRFSVADLRRFLAERSNNLARVTEAGLVEVAVARVRQEIEREGRAAAALALPTGGRRTAGAPAAGASALFAGRLLCAQAAPAQPHPRKRARTGLRLRSGGRAQRRQPGRDGPGSAVLPPPVGRSDARRRYGARGATPPTCRSSG
jgi:excisionase family DNA binding protein